MNELSYENLNYFESGQWDSKNLGVLGAGVGVDDDLLGVQGDEGGAGQGLHDGNMVISVDLLFDFLNVTHSQTVENIH